MVYQLPSSFSGGMAGAVESIKRGQLPQSITSPVVNPKEVKQTTKLPKAPVVPKYTPLTREQFMKAQASGLTPEQIIEFEKRRKAEMENIKQSPEIKPTIGEKIVGAGEQIAGFGQGLVLGTARLPGNIAGALGKGTGAIAELVGGGKNVVSESLRQTGQEIQSRLNAPANYIAGVNKDLTGTTGESVGEFTSGVATTSALLPKIPLKPGFIRGATSGATEAGIFSAGTRGEVKPSDLITGAVVGGVLGKIPTAKKLKASAQEGVRKQAEEIALPTIKELGKRDRGQLSKDVIETGKGLFKKPEIIRDAKEALAIEETARLVTAGKLKKGMTELKKLEVVDDEIENMATTLTSRLRQSDTSLSKKQMLDLFDDISKKTLENPAIVGDGDTALRKILPQLRTKLNQAKYYPDDILALRKDFDKAVRGAKGEGVFAPKLENAFTTALRDFRQGLNNKVAELVPDAQVRELLDKQSALYTVEKTLADRWAGQSGTLVGRALNKIQGITGVPRTEIVELFTALGLSSAGIPIVGPLSGGVVGATLGIKGIKSIASPKNKVLVAKIIDKFDDAILNSPNKAESIKLARTAFVNFINNLKEND